MPPDARLGRELLISRPALPHPPGSSAASVAQPALDDCCPSSLAAPIGEEEAAGLAKGFAALADPARLRLFSLIAAQPAGEVCACALVEPLGRSQPTVSHHLRILYEAGLVNRQKRGTWVWYWAVPQRVEALRAALAAEHVPAGAAGASPA
ncbi:MAG: metalloregulator ArsR/SmtB family transcription factor [Actinomycetota bacterium]